MDRKKFDALLWEFNQRVYVYEEGNWSAKGRYETALEDNDEVLFTGLHPLMVEWLENEDNKPDDIDVWGKKKSKADKEDNGEKRSHKKGKKQDK